MKVKYNHWFAPMIPFCKKKGWLYGKAIFGNLYFSASRETMLKPENQWLLRHELTHHRQQQNDKFFWFKYFYQWARNSIKNGGHVYQAYLDISFEVDARRLESLPLTPRDLELF